jgi:fatty acid desaturase
MISIRYYLPIFFQLTGIAGILAGGIWTWLGVAQLLALAAANVFCDDDLRERPEAPEALMDLPVALGAVLGFVVVVVVAWRAGQGGLSPFEVAGMIVTGGWLTVLVMVPTTHELYHKRTPWKLRLGLLSQLVYLDYMRSAPHVLGHHLHVGTPRDHDTAVRGENMYRFVVRVSLANFHDGWEWERAALARRGLPVWSPRGRIGKAAIGLVALLVGFYALGGVAGVAAGFVACLLGRVWLEGLNYLQHVGLVRAEGEPVGSRHVWNHLSPAERFAAFEITNHCEHHLDPYVPYHRLRPDPSGPRMPGVFLCFLASLVPPIWNRYILQPKLRHWDTHFASAAERQLAREANRRAGWPDWVAGAVR